MSQHVTKSRTRTDHKNIGLTKTIEPKHFADGENRTVVDFHGGRNVRYTFVPWARLFLGHWDTFASALKVAERVGTLLNRRKETGDAPATCILDGVPGRLFAIHNR